MTTTTTTTTTTTDITEDVLRAHCRQLHLPTVGALHERPHQDVVDEGVLSGEDLDRLARLFLLGDTIPFRKPEGRCTVQLQIHTPLQRWAAGYLLRRWPQRFTSLLDQARSSKAATGSAMVNGMLDSIGALGPDEAALLLDVGLVWSLGSVRPHALEIFAAQGGVEEAARRAATDPDAKMWHWNPCRPAPPVADPAKGTGLQDSLFDGGIGLTR